MTANNDIKPEAEPWPDKISPDTRLYVTPDRRIVFGAQAKQLLDQRSDSRYLSEHGVVQVDRGRWAEAQAYERDTWMCDQLGASDDRNLEHLQRFDGYQELKGRRFPAVAEFGCGPFTNSRLILDRIAGAESLTLLDPLVDEYQRHPHCTYKSGSIGGVPVTTIASSIEDFEPVGTFDILVMINVLEHCFDIGRVFDVVTKSLAPGGIFVFADCVIGPLDLPNVVANQFDTGHPIRLSSDYVADFLASSFRPVMSNTYQGLYDQTHRIDLYFIGEKI